jgi:chemotaxis signal transduction protein
MIATASGLSDRYLWFVRGETRFAAAMDYLQEVLPLPPLRSLPASDPSLAGLMVLRETILPVFDPQLLAGSTARERKASVSAVVLRLAGRPVFALIAEEVGQVVKLAAHPEKADSARIPAAFIGIVRSTNQARTLLLNVPQFAALMGLAASLPTVPSTIPLSVNQDTYNKKEICIN